MQMFCDPLRLAEELDLVRRGYELRKARRIPVVLVDSGRIYVCDSEVDPWGTRRRVSVPQFRELVEAAEVLARKPSAREEGCLAGPLVIAS